MSKVAIIGGGASGLFAACRLLQLNNKVTIFEKNSLVGKKLGITGKGRCNVTNNTSPSEMIENITKNSKFMYSSIYAFSPLDTIDFFENLKLPLKIERGNRVFPESDKAIDVVLCLKNFIIANHGNIVYENVIDIIQENSKIVKIKTKNKEYCNYDYYVLATGGLSYPITGSTGDGYKFAKKLGHTITDLKPSLSALVSSSKYCQAMQGISLKNVRIYVYNCFGKEVYNDFGEMLFTHFGVSGPIILSASTKMRQLPEEKYKLSIDLKPALSFEMLDNRLLREFNLNKNKTISNLMSQLLPSKMILPFLDYCNIDTKISVNSITKEQRSIICNNLKKFDFEIIDFRPITEAIVTSGGVNIDEINSKSMKSKKVDNLYIIGELLDVDAFTGGFNLQIAFSTANACAIDISKQNN